MKKESKFRKFAREQRFIHELTPFEHIILWGGCAASLIIFIVQVSLFPEAVKDWATWFTLVATIMSVLFAISGGKKRVICPLFGLIGAGLLMATSWKNHLFGLMIMQFVNIVTQTSSLILWFKHSSRTYTIEPKGLKPWFIAIYMAIFIGLAFLFAWLEHFDWFYKFWSGGTQTSAHPYHIRIFESLGLMLILSGVYPMVQGYKLIWYIYFFADIFQALAWAFKAVDHIGGTEPYMVFTCWSTFASTICLMISCFVPILGWRKKPTDLR